MQLDGASSSWYSVGRGSVLQSIEPTEAQTLLKWLADLPRGPGLPVVTTTEAPNFRRVVLERRNVPAVMAARSGFDVRDGNGVMFISHTGDVSPSGFR